MLAAGARAPDPPAPPLADGEVLDLGGKQVRWIDTPHVPHGWDAGILFEETTATLLCGDLFSHVGAVGEEIDRKSTRLNSSHANISYAVFCLTKHDIRVERVV